MEGLGEFLKRGREKAGISLDDLAQRTRIRVENLVSLEREDLDSLPSDAYVRGFIRQICREVGLAPNDALLRYDVLHAQGGPPDEITWSEERVEETPGRLERALEDPERVVRIAVKGGRWIAVAAGIAVLVLGGVLVRRAVQGDAREPAIAHEASRPPDPRGETAPPPREAVPAPASEAGAMPGTPDPVTATEVPAPSTAPSTAPGGSEAGADEADGMAVLELHAARSVDVTVLLDGRGAERHATLGPGEVRQWKAADHFVVSASDGGAVRLILNGRDLGPAGDDGRPTLRTIGESR